MRLSIVVGMEQPRPVIATPATPFWKTLMRSDSLVIYPFLHSLQGMILLDLGSQDLAGNYQQPHLLGDSLYVHITGTGILYAADARLSRDSLVFRRLDGTFLRGYNISAYGFVHRGRIHNMGGYGFWRWNGQLRDFNPRMQEWEIVPLDCEVPVASYSPESFVWHDKRAEGIYILRSIVGNEAVKGAPIGLDPTVRVLDLATGDWAVLGRATSYLLEGLDERRLIAESDTGLLVAHHNRIEYWLFRENRILRLADQGPLAELTTRMQATMAWMRRGWIFYGNPSKGTIDSLRIHTGMFRDTGARIYATSAPIHPRGLLLMGGMLCCLFGIGWVVGLQGAQRRAGLAHGSPDCVDGEGAEQAGPPLPDTRNVGSGQGHPPAPPVFDAVEASLLRLLLRNASEGRRTTTQEINRVLGVGNKSQDMQKRKRSDVIRAINRKYRLVMPAFTADLIGKERSGLDARLSEYTLHPEACTRVSALLDASAGAA